MIEEITGDHPKDITGVLQGLVRGGFMEQQNQRRWASYRLAVDFPQSSPQSPANSPQSQGNSPQSEADSPQSPAELLDIAEPARTKTKLPGPEVRRIIASLCSAGWLTAKELGSLMSRDPESLQERFLTAMVKDGTLELRYPGVRNRPDQAYRATKPAQ